MKRFVPVFVVLAAAMLMGAKYFITLDQARTSGILKDLKLESVEDTSGRIGAPPKFRVTKATVEYLQKLQKDNTLIEVEGNGALKVPMPNKSAYRNRY